MNTFARVTFRGIGAYQKNNPKKTKENESKIRVINPGRHYAFMPLIFKAFNFLVADR